MVRGCIRDIWPVLIMACVVGFAMGFVPRLVMAW